MQIIAALLLLLIAILLFLARKKVQTEDLERASNIGSIISTLAALTVLAFYTASLNSTTSAGMATPMLTATLLPHTPTRTSEFIFTATSTMTPVPSPTSTPTLVPSPTHPAEIAVELEMSPNGNVSVSNDFALSVLGPIGGDWTAGFENVLYEARSEEPSLYILWEDPSGGIWHKKYAIDKPFRVAIDDDHWVREIKPVGESIIVTMKPVESAPDYDDLRADIQTLIKIWDSVHYKADRYWDTSSLQTVLRGTALQEQYDTVKWLKSKNCYWEIYELVLPEIAYFEQVNTQSLIVDVNKNWDMDLYCDGYKDADDDGPFTIRYKIDNIGGAWYITEKKIIKSE